MLTSCLENRDFACTHNFQGIVICEKNSCLLYLIVRCLPGSPCAVHGLCRCTKHKDRPSGNAGCACRLQFSPMVSFTWALHGAALQRACGSGLGKMTGMATQMAFRIRITSSIAQSCRWRRAYSSRRAKSSSSKRKADSASSYTSSQRRKRATTALSRNEEQRDVVQDDVPLGAPKTFLLLRTMTPPFLEREEELLEERPER